MILLHDRNTISFKNLICENTIDVGQNGWIAKIPESLMLVFRYFTINFKGCTGFIEYVFLILIILALVMMANKLKLPYPIVLVVGGFI